MLGVQQVMRTFKMFYPELYSAYKVLLRNTAAKVKRQAIANAYALDMGPPGSSGRGTGALVGGVRSGVGYDKAWVKDVATNNGYSYPALLEYGMGRAFIRPAINSMGGKIYAEALALTQTVVDRANEGGL